MLLMPFILYKIVCIIYIWFCIVLKYLMQRKKIEAEEKRLRQRKAKEEFMKMLEVRITASFSIYPFLCVIFNYISFAMLKHVGFKEFICHIQNIILGFLLWFLLVRVSLLDNMFLYDF